MVHYLDGVHAREVAGTRFERTVRPITARFAALRSWFERFRRDAGHTTIGACRCGLPSCPNRAKRPGEL